MEEKRKNATARNEAYAKLSLKEKLARNVAGGKVQKKLLKGTVAAEGHITLDAKDWDALVKDLNGDPVEPNETLRQAAKRFKEIRYQ